MSVSSKLSTKPATFGKNGGGKITGSRNFLPPIKNVKPYLMTSLDINVVNSVKSSEDWGNNIEEPYYES